MKNFLRWFKEPNFRTRVHIVTENHESKCNYKKFSTVYVT